MTRYIPVGGVQWCPVHQGVADELSSHSDQCDMAHRDDDPDECELRTLYVAAGEQPKRTWLTRLLPNARRTR